MKVEACIERMIEQAAREYLFSPRFWKRSVEELLRDGMAGSNEQG